MFITNRKPSIIFLLFFLLQTGFCAIAQEKKEEKPQLVQFHGFINYELLYDTRLCQTSRDGEVVYFPKPFEGDKNGVDKNAHGKLHMFTFHTRLRAEIKEFDVLKMKASGIIEGDFIGSNDGNPNVLRLRHAYMKLSSSKFEWLAGQYWHPMFVTDCFPDIISWGAAAPIHVLNRSPQLRLTYFPTQKISLMGAVLSQRDLPNCGPLGNSTEYLKNSQIPEIQFQLSVKPNAKIVAGFTAGYKVIAPRLVTDSGYVCNESLASYNLNVFARYKGDKLDFKLEGIFGQNQSNLLVLGGYGVSKITDKQTNTKEYVNMNNGSVWAEISYKIKDFRLGMFAGYTQGFGTNSYVNEVTEVYGLGTNIKFMYNISPRVVYAPGRMKFGLELKNTAASFGTYNNYLEIEKDKKEESYRYLFSVSLNF